MTEPLYPAGDNMHIVAKDRETPPLLSPLFGSDRSETTGRQTKVLMLRLYLSNACLNMSSKRWAGAKFLF